MYNLFCKIAIIADIEALANEQLTTDFYQSYPLLNETCTEVVDQNIKQLQNYELLVFFCDIKKCFGESRLEDEIDAKLISTVRCQMQESNAKCPREPKCCVPDMFKKCTCNEILWQAAGKELEMSGTSKNV